MMTDRSSAGEARRVAMAAAESLGFGAERRNDIGIVATEAANNVLLHAGSGEFLVCPFRQDSTVWLDMMALDNAQGIRDIPRAMEDGFSTLGTAGHGLGAIQRISDDFSLYSLPQRGTVLWSRFWVDSTRVGEPYGVINVPLKGETENGDSYLVLRGASRSLYMMVDGLGHGAHAAEAANEAVATVRGCSEEPAAEIVLRTHDALKKTRGAAMSVAIVEHERKIVTYSGVGNISAAIVATNSTRNMVSQNGTLGASITRVHEYTYPFDNQSALLMFSDGISTKCSLSGYPGLQGRPPELVAGVLYRDFSRRRDDSTVLFSRLGGDAQ